MLAEGTCSPNYLSPEMILRHHPDARSDVYAWGVMMYGLLCGELPFRGRSWLESVSAHLHQTPRSLFEINRGIQLELDSIIVRTGDGLRSLHDEGKLPSGINPDLTTTMLATLQGGTLLAQVHRSVRRSKLWSIPFSPLLSGHLVALSGLLRCGFP
ncbi:MAG: protein kinase domain-containing protein [Actinomycetota bacterium]